MEEIRNTRIEKGKVFINGTAEFSHEDHRIRSFTKQVYRHFGLDYAKFYKMSPLSKLGFLAAELLLRGMDLAGTDPGKVSVILANSSSSLHTDTNYQESVEIKPSPAIFVYTLPNIVIGEICIRHGFKGEGLFFIQKEYDRDFIFAMAEEQLKKEQGSFCLAGWVEVDMDGGYLAELSLIK